jgi:hypothetical protein
MDAARFDLGEVDEKGGEELVRSPDEQARRDQELRVGEIGR